MRLASVATSLIGFLSRVNKSACDIACDVRLSSVIIPLELYIYLAVLTPLSFLYQSQPSSALSSIRVLRSCFWAAAAVDEQRDSAESLAARYHLNNSIRD